MAKFNYSNLNKKNVDQLIQSAFRSVSSMRNAVQVAAVGVLMHAEKCGDWTKARELVDGLGNSVYTASLVAWFVEYGGLVVGEITEADESGKEVKKETFTGWQGREYIRNHFQDAKAKAWWEVKKQVSPYKGFDDYAELAKLVQRIQKAKSTKEAALKEGDEEKASKVVIHPTLEQALLTVLSDFEDLANATNG